MKLLIIDDEPLARLLVQEYLQPYPELQVIEECGDGFQGLKAIQQHQPDLIFLDIQMPKINGFEMLELIENPPAVIFTTAFDEYAIKAFETHAVDYLLKPFSKARFDKAVQKFLASGIKTSAQLPALIEVASHDQVQRERIVVKNGSKIKIIPVNEIYFIEAADDYGKIFTAEGNFLKNKTMSHFEKQLEPLNFIRCHRSYVLNLAQVVKLEVHEKDNHLAILRSGHKVPVSKSGYVRLKQVLGI